jgi:hypothetical protein
VPAPVRSLRRIQSDDCRRRISRNAQDRESCLLVIGPRQSFLSYSLTIYRLLSADPDSRCGRASASPALHADSS